MDGFLWLRLVHILGAGTGLGIAFFMFMADRGGDVRAIAATARLVVIADGIFTATAAIIQPVTGLLLVYAAGYQLSDLWIWLTIVLYLIIGACWLPAVWLQLRMRDLAIAAAERDRPLGDTYRRAMRFWFALGWPAFVAIVGIFVLMVFKPV